jgi:hypothetical protein
MRVTERFQRTDLGHTALTVTVDDPKAYLKPWTIKTTLNLMADTEMIESFCDTQTTIMSHWAVTPPPPEPPWTAEPEHPQASTSGHRPTPAWIPIS